MRERRARCARGGIYSAWRGEHGTAAIAARARGGVGGYYGGWELRRTTHVKLIKMACLQFVCSCCVTWMASLLTVICFSAMGSAAEVNAVWANVFRTPHVRRTQMNTHVPKREALAMLYSINYVDILSIVAPRNARFLAHQFVVTATNDTKTRAWCEAQFAATAHNNRSKMKRPPPIWTLGPTRLGSTSSALPATSWLTCLHTHEVNKGIALQMAQTAAYAWANTTNYYFISTDSDVLLPEDFDKSLQSLPPADPLANKIYSMPRLVYDNPEMLKLRVPDLIEPEAPWGIHSMGFFQMYTRRVMYPHHVLKGCPTCGVDGDFGNMFDGTYNDFPRANYVCHIGPTRMWVYNGKGEFSGGEGKHPWWITKTHEERLKENSVKWAAVAQEPWLKCVIPGTIWPVHAYQRLVFQTFGDGMYNYAKYVVIAVALLALCVPVPVVALGVLYCKRRRGADVAAAEKEVTDKEETAGLLVESASFGTLETAAEVPLPSAGAGKSEWHSSTRSISYTI